MQLRRISISLALLVLLAACILPARLSGTSTPSEAPPADTTSPQPIETAASPEQVETAVGTDMIHATLSLRSVSMTLSAVYPDGPVRSLEAQVDASGNVHLTQPFSLPPDVQLESTPESKDWNQFEVYIVSGHAYILTGEGEVTEAPASMTMLEEALRGPEGPGLWLVLVGTRDLEPAAHEQVGGFKVIRYPVNAALEEGAITGTLWMDETSLALVRADLKISPLLFSNPASPANGDLSITLDVVRKDIPEIKLP